MNLGSIDSATYYLYLTIFFSICGSFMGMLVALMIYFMWTFILRSRDRNVKKGSVKGSVL